MWNRFKKWLKSPPEEQIQFYILLGRIQRKYENDPSNVIEKLCSVCPISNQKMELNWGGIQSVINAVWRKYSYHPDLLNGTIIIKLNELFPEEASRYKGKLRGSDRIRDTL